jgi:hypothetical protein
MTTQNKPPNISTEAISETSNPNKLAIRQDANVEQPAARKVSST